MKEYHAIVIGSSLGGLRALDLVLCHLPSPLPVPLLVAQHLDPNSHGQTASVLSHRCAIPIKEAEDKEFLVPGKIYLAPPNYHLLVEKDYSLSLSVDEKENYSRPSIDVLFESAADVFAETLIALILTGASADGARGLEKVKQRGGLTVVQDPASAEAPTMPAAALRAVNADLVLPLLELGPWLGALGNLAFPVKDGSRPSVASNEEVEVHA